MDNYKEKYEQALGWMQSLYDGLHGKTKEEAEHFFPELKESEDERVRKDVISFVEQAIDAGYGIISKERKEKWLAWLENQEKRKFKVGDIISNGKAVYRVENIIKNCIGQDCYFLVNVKSEKEGLRYLPMSDSRGKTSNFGETTWLCEQVDKLFEKQCEQNPDDKIEPKFKIGDWAIYEHGEYSATLQIKNIVDGTYEFTNNFTLNVVDEYTLRLWTIQDAKAGDVLSWDDSKCIALFKNVYDKESFNSYGFVGGCTGAFKSEPSYHDIKGAHPASKEQRDLLFQKMKESGYEWDIEKKELREIEQKPAEEVDLVTKFKHKLDSMSKEELEEKWKALEEWDNAGPTVEEFLSGKPIEWSEEDESNLQGIIDEIEANKHNAPDYDLATYDKFLSWLKSFKNRVESKQGEQKLANPAKMNKNEQKSADNDWVDLDLPSGTLWKSQNETNPNDDNNFYTFDDAIQKFGDRLPTREQWEELKDCCEWIWGSDGRECKIKVIGKNGNSIFLSPAGCRSYNGDVYYMGSKGYYWSSMPDGSNCAWGFYFNSGGFSMYNGYRNYGRSVRLVKVCADCSEMNMV